MKPSKNLQFLLDAARSTRADCIEWPFSKVWFGYGRCHYKGCKAAHRVMYLLAHGPIPQGMCVCHSCDNPSCVNPKHLFIGTVKDNVRDMDVKGRRKWLPKSEVNYADNRGERHGRHLVTENDVRKIRSRYASGEMQRVLAEQFGIKPATVGNIVRRENWKHVV